MVFSWTGCSLGGREGTRTWATAVRVAEPGLQAAGSHVGQAQGPALNGLGPLGRLLFGTCPCIWASLSGREILETTEVMTWQNLEVDSNRECPSGKGTQVGKDFPASCLGSWGVRARGQD